MILMQEVVTDAGGEGGDPMWNPEGDFIAKKH